MEPQSAVTRQRISEALFLAGFGITWALDMWWPGLLVAFGLAWGTSLAIEGKRWAATVVAVLLCAVPVAYFAVESWDPLVPFAVVGLGAAGVVRALVLRQAGRAEK